MTFATIDLHVVKVKPLKKEKNRKTALFILLFDLLFC